MVSGRRVGAASWLAAACFLCVSCLTPPAHAGDDDDAHVLLFSGRDLWRNGAFLYGGVVMAPGGFERDGFLLKLIYSVGLYRYNASNLGGEEVTGGETVGAFMPGWRIKRGNLEMKFFAGPDFEYHPLWPDDPANRLRGHAIGLRMAAEFWYEPTPSTMIAGDASISSIVGDTTARLAYGWRVFDDLLDAGFYVGPEVQYFSSYGYRHLRLGVHVTGLKTENHEWSAGLGWAQDSVGRASPYLRLGFLTRR